MSWLITRKQTRVRRLCASFDCRARAVATAEKSFVKQAEMDGVQQPEARLEEEVPLALLEDELDAAGHPWISPFLGRFVDTIGAGRGALCSTPAAQCSYRSTAGATAFSVMDVIVQSQQSLGQQQQHLQQRLLPDVLRRSTWDIVRGVERAMLAVGSEGGAYSKLRSSFVMSMLQLRTVASL